MTFLRRLSLACGFQIIVAVCLIAQPYYVSTTGSDSNPGTIDSAFQTIPQAITVAVAGDTIYVRGGTYICTTRISIGSKSGVSNSKMCYLWAYPGERPLLDFSSITGTSSDGLSLSGSYWYIKGIDVKGAPHNGLKFSGGSNNIVEFCSFFENRNTGCQVANGASNNRIINCDSYYNYDAPGGGNADGFSPKLDVGTGNYFYGCRSWQNSDDGFDGYLRPSDNVTTTLENCWSFMNGYLKDGNPIVSGNGNGFKMGGGDNSNRDSLRHNMTLKNCLCFDNRVKGFDQNNNRGSMTLLNCTGYRNGDQNYKITGIIRSTSTVTVKNCAELGGKVSLASYTIQQTNSWINPPFATVTTTDFKSIDTTGVRGPRKANGDLPDITFMHLAAGSQLIDAGTNIGLPYNSNAPDLGAFESSDTSAPITIQLASFFAAHIGGTQFRLEWTTLSEINNYGFYVQRWGTADMLWSDLPNSFVAGHATTTQMYQYAFIDSNVAIGSWYYRLKQVEVGGVTHFTDAIHVNGQTKVEEYAARITSFQLSQNYPNPFNPSTVIRFSVAKAGFAKLLVINILGQQVATLFSGHAEPGTSYPIQFNAASLPSGVYFSVLESDRKQEVKKMLLMK
jgi:hypothetical protein